jgi:glycosyltransferase involved in cell wall biosynthesis
MVNAVSERADVTIGVVIPCRNEAHWIAEVLDALLEQDRRPDEVVVVDDGSTDGTGAEVDRWRLTNQSMPLRIIAGQARGVAAAVNTGIAALGTDVVVRLDGHCRPAADYVRRTSELAVSPGVGVAGGAWTIRPSAESTEAAAIAIAVEHPLGSGGAAYRRPSPVQQAAVESVESVDTVPFGCFRRSLWRELGGLDERLWSNEDYDFNFRVRQRGLQVALDPAIRCTYYARPTLATLARQYGRYGWWKARMLAHHPQSIRWRQLIPSMLVPGLLVCSIGLMLRDERLWPILLAAYPAVVILGAVHAALTHRRLAAAGWIAAAFFTIQLMWSAGFWASMLSGNAGVVRRQETRRPVNDNGSSGEIR